MSERLESFEFSRDGQNGSTYDQYLDGGIYPLVVGVDIPSLGSRHYFHTLAKKRGKRIRIAAEANALIVQAYEAPR